MEQVLAAMVSEGCWVMRRGVQAGVMRKGSRRGQHCKARDAQRLCAPPSWRSKLLHRHGEAHSPFYCTHPLSHSPPFTLTPFCTRPLRHSPPSAPNPFHTYPLLHSALSALTPLRTHLCPALGPRPALDSPARRCHGERRYQPQGATHRLSDHNQEVQGGCGRRDGRR